MTNQSPEVLMKQIAHLEKAIIELAPKVTEAMQTFHKLRNKHTSLIAEHRDLQKDLRVLNGQITKLSTPTSTTKPLGRPKVSTKTLVEKLSKEEKSALRALLMGE